MERIFANACERNSINFYVDVPADMQDTVRTMIEADGYLINEDGTTSRV